MANSAGQDEQRDSEIAKVADKYFRERKNRTAETIDALFEKHPHLGQDLRESLEAIELFRSFQRLTRRIALLAQSLVTSSFITNLGGVAWGWSTWQPRFR